MVLCIIHYISSTICLIRLFTRMKPKYRLYNLAFLILILGAFLYPLALWLVPFLALVSVPLKKLYKAKPKLYYEKKEFWKYYQSPIWKVKRKQRLEYDKHRCQHCGCGLTVDTAHIHHLHYKTFTEECIQTDLISLCSRCHYLEHQRWVT